MKTLLIAAVLALASWSSQAQVTASTDTLALPPTLMPGDSDWRQVIFTNDTDEPIEVYGTGSNGPFTNRWDCSGGTYVVLQPYGTCTLDVRAFHRQVLTDGAMPMDVLQTKIREWIASEKAAAVAIAAAQ